jgi:hypothetical protein
MTTEKTDYPAIRSYFFGKGYSDLGGTIAESWKRNMDSANAYFEKASQGNGLRFVLGSTVLYASGLSILVFGTIFFLLASAVHVVFLSIAFLLFYICFTMLWVVERAYLAVRSFFMACPHCHARSLIPEYLCDGCGAAHSRLLPSAYGILNHFCRCGRKLPASFFLNRGRLQARCPSCRRAIAREHVETKRLFVPVMGGPSVGKSAFLYSAVMQLVEGDANGLGFTAKPLDARNEATYQRAANQLRGGRPPEKTSDPIPRAFNLSLYRGRRRAFLLYLYDPAGEAYQGVGHLDAHAFHEYLTGMVLMVDPFAIPAVRSRYASRLTRKNLNLIRPSDLPTEDCLDRLLLALESRHGLSKLARVRQPLAIVISKVDAFDLEDVVGETAVRRAISEMQGGPEAVDREEVRNQVLKSQLIQWGEQAFVNRVEERFTNVRFFSSSALGRMPDGTQGEFRPIGVLPPLFWIFKQADGSFAGQRTESGGPGARPEER